MPKSAGKWKELGAQLLSGDCLAKLTVIETNHPKDVERCCKCVFEKWLETREDASWNQLIQALESQSVQLSSLASEINQVIEAKGLVLQ